MFRPVLNPARPWLAQLCLGLLILAGCRSGAQTARHERTPATQTVAEQSKPAKTKNSRSQATTVAGSDQPSASLASEGRPADKSRRLIPDWFRLGQDKESVPLPTTPGSDSVAVDEAVGPVEQFQ
jgi:hypothetical protein